MLNNTLKIENIHKSYGSKKVVNNVSFTVEGGKIVGLIGPNGAGKTTCFYIVCGLLRTNEGEIFINQHNLSGLPMHKRAALGLGYLPQEPSIFRRLSVEDNILAVLQLRKTLEKTQIAHKLEQLLAEFNIEHIRHIQGISLSGGERRRVEIARALAMEPKFILLDEPFAGVDPISIDEIQQIIYHLKDKGIGILITDHNYRAMLDTCDYAYVLHHGSIIAEGNKKKILANKQVKTVYLGENG